MAGALLLDASALIATNDAGDPHRADVLALLALPTAVHTLDLAYYESANVAVRSWRDTGAADRLRGLIRSIETAEHLVRADAILMTAALGIAEQYGISAYDASYVAAARAVGAQLVSCDVRDLVSRGLAVLPGDALS